MNHAWLKMFCIQCPYPLSISNFHVINSYCIYGQPTPGNSAGFCNVMHPIHHQSIYTLFSGPTDSYDPKLYIRVAKKNRNVLPGWYE